MRKINVLVSNDDNNQKNTKENILLFLQFHNIRNHIPIYQSISNFNIFPEFLSILYLYSLKST